MAWMNHYIQLPGTAPAEIDVIVQGADADSCWALFFEIKNRDAANLPTMAEAQVLAKIAIVRQWLAQDNKKIRFIFPVYLSVKAFETDVEVWLHEQGVFTADLESWMQPEIQ